ncbi:helix-turn-helix domain-containing protein [Adhaeribacter pallidiroseus]|uniref:HTH cro/C1-type domain-containing protein n=1 Tax=Adhaeribacter pallidiroseus TaxID=2072847 RepID=A0A369Q1P6_9BACT|nr:helix-turn-helix transcriptional regulator [Adhaeribacter pallidiroseus]RDC58813.1 hypothetical protein AHMF7616_05247 [Adhaeribacter pallidiroseus]
MEQQEASAYLRAFGQHLKQLRETRQLTQANVAFEAGLSVSQVQRIEYGQHNFTVLTLVALARALEIPVAQLLAFPGSIIRQERTGSH